MKTAYLSDRWFKDNGNYQRLVLEMKYPKIITVPGQYKTRSGELVTVNALTQKHAFGLYSNGIEENWYLTGHIWPTKECQNDIVEKVN